MNLNSWLRDRFMRRQISEGLTGSKSSLICLLCKSAVCSAMSTSSRLELVVRLLQSPKAWQTTIPCTTSRTARTRQETASCKLVKMTSHGRGAQAFGAHQEAAEGAAETRARAAVILDLVGGYGILEMDTGCASPRKPYDACGSGFSRRRSKVYCLGPDIRWQGSGSRRRRRTRRC